MAKKLLCLLLTFIIIFTLLPATAVFAEEAEAQEEQQKPAVTLDDIIKAASNVVRENEGYYHSVNADDNGALSIGWIQWHANRALSLLRTIVAADGTKALELLGEELYNEILTAASWATRVLTSEETEKISALISTDAGKKAQDDLAAQDLSAYISRAMGYGITDPAALVYYADIENQCGSGGAKRVAAAAAALAGSYEAVTLEHIHRAALADTVAGKYATRRNKTYNNCLLLDWEVISTKLEVWDILSARNVRATPDTSSTLVTTISKGTKVIISEKALFGTQTRGKTSMGWITLDSASCALNEELTGGYVAAPVIFDTNGGTFGSVPKSTLTVNGTNCSRSANTLILYDGDYPYSAPQTNEYGAEAAVGSDGIVISAPTYGTCKTQIPEGGFVLSGIGTGYTSLVANVKKGNYVRFEKSTMTLYIYESYAAYLDLRKAVGSVSLINDSRPSNSLVLYNGEYSYGVPQTNAYGTEIAVDKDGKVLNDPVYGLCKTQIPVGGFVLSGIGTGYTWLSQNVKAGNYILYDSEAKSLTVYPDRDKLLASTKTTQMNSPYGDLPVPQKSGWAFNGWYIDPADNKIASDSICSSPFCITLKADWTQIGNNIILDTNGGIFAAATEKALDGVNVFRPANSIILYNGDYPSSTTPTNEYGGEAAVGADGIVISDPVYGTCKTDIPEGGFVLSGIGSGYEWLRKNVKTGCYVIFDNNKGTVTVYESKAAYDSLTKSVVPGCAIGALPEAKREYHKFLGWYTADGKAVTESTVMPEGGLYLTAKWEVLPGKLTIDLNGGTAIGLISSATLSGTNVSRGSNALVIYKDKASTGTNAYGSEAIILNDGTVLSVFPYGSKNTAIPAGAYVISGNGTMHTWIQKNLSQGNYVTVTDGTVTVWKDRASSESNPAVNQIKYGEKYPALPEPAREGYVFLGWQDKDGNTVKNGDTVMNYGDVTLTAKWEKLASVNLNAGGGKLLSAAVSVTAAGINVSRGSNALVIYAGKASTGTNIYGTEAVVGSDGKVCAVYQSGSGNAKIPEGGFVISGNGTMSNWIRDNVKVGSIVALRGYTVTVYESEIELDAADGALYIQSGTALPALPAATLSGKAFAGWADANGKEYKAGSTVDSDITLYAKWSATEAILRFDTQGGFFNGPKGSYTLNGINVSRGANTLILYNSDYSNSYPYTNAYGTEVAVDKNGIVLSSPRYGTCKTPIPEGGFVLSGIGTGYTWMVQNIKAGNYVSLEGNVITVYESYDDYLASKGKIIEVGKAYGPLPTPKKDGFIFAGWKDLKNNPITESTVVSDCDNPVIYATWSVPVTVTFDTVGGSMVYTTATVDGTNVGRGSNKLILYKDKATTGTNIYGSEALVNANGEVIAVYGYGKGNNAIPEGCFALSGNGTMSTWISNHVTVGSYIVMNGDTVEVYRTKLAFDAKSGSVTLPKDTVISVLPIPSREEAAFAGWNTADGKAVTDGYKVTESVTLVARWSASSATLVFNANGGSFKSAKGAYTLNGINVSRGANSIILYNSDYSGSYPQTNAYGTEVAVDENGIVLSSPRYGTCKTPIPEGGFVLSGIGTGYTWMVQNIKAGNYVSLKDNVITVYESYNDYLGTAGKKISVGKAYGTLPTPEREGFVFAGWQDNDKNTVTETTVVTGCEVPVLTAVWKKLVTVTFDSNGGSYACEKTVISGTNVGRGTNQLILYKDKATTGTNIYGTEVVVNGDGKVVAVYGYGKGNNAVPEDGFVLSGNGTMSEWLSKNVTAGCCILLNNKTVCVYDSEITMLAAKGELELFEGSSLGSLPEITKYGYDFGGWKDGAGASLDPSAPLWQSTVLTATWTPKTVIVTFDGNGGALAPAATYTADGKNVYRGTGKLIIYEGKDSTGTNIYGTEVIVGADGIVTEIRPYGYGDAAIPEGGFVLSGHDAGAEWLKTNVAVGDTVRLDGLNISVYKEGKGTTLEREVAFGSSFGTLPTPIKNGAAFLGWYTTDGIKVSQNTFVNQSDKAITLVAKWA